MMKGETALEKILSRLEPEDKRDGQYQAHCPAHDDQRASLSIKETEPGGKVLLHCHAGCDYFGILQAMDLSESELYGTKGNGPKHASSKIIVATYDYVDEEGRLKYQVVRFEPKGFAQRHPDGKGGWKWDLKGMKKVPYRLPEVIKGIEEGKPIIIVEGEKDADNLAKLGLTATTNSGGAGKWDADHSKWLGGAEVVILPDNDVPGRKHAKEVSESLKDIARSVKIIRLPGLPAKGDVSDWIEEGGTAQDLIVLISKADECEQDEEQAGGDPLGCSDLGNARRFARKFSGKVKYCNEWGTWLIYDGKRWAADKKLQIEDMAKSIPIDIYKEVADLIMPDDRVKLSKHAHRSESAYSIKELLKLAASDPSIAVTHEVFDADSMLINVLNGAVNLNTGELEAHSPELLMTKLAPVTYSPEATSEAWESFIRTVTGGDEELIRFLQKAVGYSLTGNTSDDVLFFVYGPTATGKSTFLEAIKATLGGYAKTADFESFLKLQSGGGPRDDIAILEGARMVVGVEVDEGKRLAEGLIKKLTGGDTIACRPLYKSTIEFLPVMKLWLAANHKPKVSAEDSAMWRRIRILPFDKTIPEEKRDPSLKAKLKDTTEIGPAILAWAVKGCLLWRQEGLKPPKVVKEASEEYRKSQDIIGEFIEDQVEACEGERLSRKSVFKAYKQWCEENGERPVSQSVLTLKLKEQGWRDAPRGRERSFEGYRLKNPYELSGQEEDSAEEELGSTGYSLEQVNEILSEQVDWSSDGLAAKR